MSRLSTLKDSELESKTAYAQHMIGLLLLSIQQKRLVGPFKTVPIDDDDQIDFDGALKIIPADISRMVRQEDFREFGTPPYSVEVSGNLREYVAYQEIPQFGAHFYYAFSGSECVYDWEQAEKAIMPVGYQHPTLDSSFRVEDNEYVAVFLFLRQMQI